MNADFLVIMLYVLGAVLLVALIVLVIKIIYSVNRINFLLDNVERKMKTFDKAFNAVDKVVDTLSFASDKFVDGLTSIVSKVFKKKKNKIEKESEEL